jgi:hypothetical protein
MVSPLLRRGSTSTGEVRYKRRVLPDDWGGPGKGGSPEGSPEEGSTASGEARGDRRLRGYTRKGGER